MELVGSNFDSVLIQLNMKKLPTNEYSDACATPMPNEKITVGDKDVAVNILRCADRCTITAKGESLFENMENLLTK